MAKRKYLMLFIAATLLMASCAKKQHSCAAYDRVNVEQVK